MLLEKLAGCRLTDKQIERLSHHYGAWLEAEQVEEKAYQAKDDLHYAMVDGSMVLTRQDGWREMKLGRLFAAQELRAFKGRKEIRSSVYTAHLGGHCAFFDKFERHLDGCKKLVVVADGAQWIWDYFEVAFPDAIPILDFYHAAEKLSTFAHLHFPHTQERNNWVENQRQALLHNQVQQVIQTLEALPCKGQALQGQKQIITYFKHNQHRMQYQTYEQQGFLIGSGAIEGAHRHVIQQRLKLAGQRWTLDGVQQVANLRVAAKSDQWNKVVHAIKIAA